MHHTLEPWNVSPTPLGNIRIADSGENTIALITSGAGKRKRGANAKRIVACVNACAGIEDPAKALAAAVEALLMAEDRLPPMYSARCRTALDLLAPKP